MFFANLDFQERGEILNRCARHGHIQLVALKIEEISKAFNIMNF